MIDKRILVLCERLGAVKCRSMFGGFGVFIDGTMIGLYINDKPHLKANSRNKVWFVSLNFQPYVYLKRRYPVISNYYLLTDECYEDDEKLITLLRCVLRDELADKAEAANTKSQRLKDLPNFKLSAERMLRKAGIDSVEALQAHGSIEAYLMVKRVHEFDIGIDFLWSIHDAINGIHKGAISTDHRAELLANLEVYRHQAVELNPN